MKQMRSGWCETGSCSRCPELLQVADGRRREIRCDCTCHGLEYLTTLPAEVPAGRVLVHNTVRAARRLGSRGFRAWLVAPDSPRLTVCDCDWAPELGIHYRIERQPSPRLT